MTKIKICGNTNKEDALEAARLGVDMLGFVFYKGSKRAVDAATAGEIIKDLPPFICRVGVFVNEKREAVLEIAEKCRLDILQFHGSESQDYCAGFGSRYKVMKAIRVKDRNSLPQSDIYGSDFYLLDAYREGEFGGTGESFDWDILQGVEFAKPVVLSGGLTPENVAEAIEKVMPYGVDVASGVETSPGKKDKTKLSEFVKRVRERG